MKIFGMVPGSLKWKTFMKYFYGYGAAVVILGALFKIMHWPGASVMLVTGLLVEVAIFIMSSFEPLPHDYHWDLVYPELAQVHEPGDGEDDLHGLVEEGHKEHDKPAHETGLTSDAQEGESFGEQMQKVSKNLAALNNVYELQLKGSSAHLEATEKFQSQVTEMMANLSASTEDTRLYKENMAMLSKNLTDLNNVYGNMLKAMTISRD